MCLNYDSIIAKTSYQSKAFGDRKANQNTRVECLTLNAQQRINLSDSKQLPSKIFGHGDKEYDYFTISQNQKIKEFFQYY